MEKASEILRTHSASILDLWLQEAKKKVPAARSTDAISLYDHLPNIIEDIAVVLEQLTTVNTIEEEAGFKKLIDNSKQHGRHRAATANYTVEQVVFEYMIFHQIVSNFLKEHNALNDSTTKALKILIETSILKSVSAFSESIQEMQEKLIGTLAHDIRNPLAAAQMSLEMIKMDQSPEWSGKMLGAATRSVDKAIHLIEDLMNGITVRAGEGMLLNFKEENLLKDIKSVYKEATEVYASEILLECAKDEILGVFDVTAIRRLLENIISNAVKYGSYKEPITLKVVNEPEKVIIFIHNEGTPILPEKQKHIFDFLGRENRGTASVRKSWGMGLTLAQIVAEAHGGDIKLVSNEKEGTTFTITLLKRFNKPGEKRTKLTFIENHN